MRLDVRHRLKPPSSPADILARHAWKLGLGVIVAALLTARGVTEAPVHLSQRSLAAGGGPTVVACGALPAGTTTWNTAGSPYILPLNTTNDPIPNDPNACPAFPLAGQPQPASPPGVVVLPGSTLVIDAGQGPVQIFSHGAGITVDGGELRTINTSAIPGNFVSFDAEPDVASWDGISIIASDSSHRGNASLSYTSIAHALTSIAITSGAVATDDPLGSGAQVPYGLALANVAIGPSYFDGIDATDTPISFVGQADAGGLATGLYGTVNNIGSQGIKVGFDSSAPSIPAKAVQIKAVTFGSSVPFGETSCLPLQACAAGSIGNDAIQGLFTTGQRQPIELSGNRFFRAGSYGLELTNANNPTIINNIFTCNGSGSAKPVITCVGSGLRYSAIYLSGVTNLNVGASGLNNNKGQQNGLDAVVLNGQVVSDLPWQTPSNDPNLPTIPPSPPNPPHALGYMVANGDLQLVNSKLTLIDGDVVKVKGGAIVITNGSLEASSAGLKTFTSLRDNTVGIQACPSVFVQSCPSPLPANEWIGFSLVGSTANITNASILFPTKAIDISGGRASLIGPDGGSYGLVVTKSRLGPTFSDSVAVNATPVYISASKFCRIDTIPSDATYLQCSGAGPGDHGINASYTGTPRPAAGGGLKLIGNDFQGSTNEAILGTALGGRPVDIENNSVESAGAYGIHLVAADTLTLKANAVTGSGTGSVANPTTYPAIYLDGISKADFSGPIGGNSGNSNGLDAIAFHGSTADLKPLKWKTVGASSALGYLIDGDLAVNGDLSFAANDYAPVLGGAITMHNGTLTATGGVLTSLKEHPPQLPSCGSVFVPKVSGACPAAAPGDWTGLVLDPGVANSLKDAEIRYAVTGISVGPPTVPPVPLNLTMTRSNVRNTAADGVATQSPVSITDGAFTGNGGRGIKVDLSGVSPSSAQQLAIIGHTSISGSGQDGIQAIALSGHPVTITGVKVDGAGAFGINLQGADNLTLTNNTVTNSAATYPAIYLNGFTGPFRTSVSPFIFNNMGAGNGIDAIAFHGTVTDNLTWQTARKTTDPTQPLGYVLDNTLNMQSGTTLTVNAGDIVKVGNGGAINLPGAALRADDILTSTQKIFTSLTDNGAGVVACPSVVQSGCGPNVTAAPGDWAGINLSGSTAKGTVVNASVRYAGTGISITNGATSTYGSSSFGLVVSQSTVASTKTDGVFATNTAVSVTDSIISGGIHGANITLTNGPSTPAAARLSGNQFMSQSAEAILGQGLFGQPIWITDNRVQNAGTFGIRLLNSNNLVLRNNNVVGSGGGPGAGAGRYPAIYLPNVSADFARNVRGNVGSGNGLDSIAFDGTVTSDLTWVTPDTNTTTGALGYLLDGGLTLDGTTLTVNPDGVVKALGGPITINGGSLNVAGTLGHEAIFTSLKDNASGTVASAVSCPSVFVSVSDCGQPQAGNWGGIAITDKAGQRGNNTIDYSVIEYAITGISIDSGPVTTALPKLKVTNSKILHTSLDGIRASDTPIDVEGSTIGDQATATPGTPPDIRGNGIIASFFSPAGCPSPTGCVRLTLIGNYIYSTGKDGIVANGLGGQPTVVQGNHVTVSGTYGIRLVGADQLTLTGNHVDDSGIAANAYPAIYLNNVSGDFNTAITANVGSGNGLNAIVFHGTVTTTGLQPDFTWLTPDPSGVQPLGYMLDGALTVNGNFKATDGVVKMLTDGITIHGGLTSTRTIYTSLKENSSPFACNSVFVPAACPGSVASSDYWGGISVVGGASTFTGGELRNSKLGLTVTGATLAVTGQAHFSYVAGDAITVKTTAAKSKFEDLTMDHVTGNGVKLVNADATFSRDVFTTVTGTGNYAISSTGGTATIDCSSFHGNANGVSFDGTSSISDSDAYNNTTYDVVGTGGTPTATGVWWGTPNTGGNVTGVTVSELLSGQSPVFSDRSVLGGKVEILGSNPTATDTLAVRALGIGTMTVKLTSSRRMDPNTVPTVTFTTGAVGDPTRNVTGGSWTNRVWTSSAYPLDTVHATAGLNHLSVTGGQSCIPDGSRAAISPVSPKDFYAAVLPTVVAVQPGATATYGGTTILSATLKSGGAPVVNETVSPIQFTILDAASHSFATATAGTDGTGLATTAAISVAGLNASPPTYGLSAVFRGDNLYSVSDPDASQTLLINKVATVTTSAASATSVKTGTAVTDQAAITGAASSTAGGKVTYNLFNTVGCTGSPVFSITTASFTNDVVPASAAWTAMPPGTYQWQATYNGDGNHIASISVCGSDTVTVTISTPTIATAVAPASPVVTGTSVKNQATLTGATSNAGGTVTYMLYSGSVCTGSAVYTSNPAAVANGVVAQSAPSFAATPAGSYTWQATYSGDINNQTATSTCGSDPLVVNNAAPVISSVSPATGTVAGNTPVTITGTNLDFASTVTFGGVAGVVVTVSNTQIQAKSPPEAAGTVDILVTTPSGTSTVNAPNDQYTFVTYAATIGADAPTIFWRLGEANGLAGAADGSGGGHTGAYTSTGVAYGVAGAPANDTDTAVTLDGLTGAVQETSGAGAPVGSSARSLEIWFKTSTATAQPLFNYGTSGLLSQFAVYLAGNQVQVKDGTDPLLTVTAASSLADGAWHHLVVTYDGATSIAVYVDGAAVGSAQATSAALSTVLDVTGLEVGRDNAATPVFFNGTLDEAAIYNTVLSPARVAAHFAAGEGG